MGWWWVGRTPDNLSHRLFPNGVLGWWERTPEIRPKGKSFGFIVRGYLDGPGGWGGQIWEKMTDWALGGTP